MSAHVGSLAHGTTSPLNRPPIQSRDLADLGDGRSLPPGSGKLRPIPGNIRGMHRSAIGFLGVVALLSAGAARAEENGAAPSSEASTDSTIAPETVFPIPGTERADPHFADGKFGAFRPGRAARHDCGRGHCGIDLIASVGTPVVAVKSGLIAQIDNSSTGEGGRWIRVAHEDGTCTWYMHLAHVRKGLIVG